MALILVSRKIFWSIRMEALPGKCMEEEEKGTGDTC
jgi:hypothetical protein